jgi:uncharacterized protein (TIGR03067 family)
MTTIAFGALCFLVLPGQVRQEPDPAVKEELGKLQGSWQVESQEENGKKLGEEELKGRTICFGQNLFLLRQNAKMIQLGKLKIDPSKSPKTINTIVEKGVREGDILPGIYHLDGDTLKICLNKDGEGRPKEFKTEPKSGLTLMVCKRVQSKPAEGDLTGAYRAVSIDAAGNKISYDANIERIGDAYLVVYRAQGKVIYFGTGLRHGDVFAMCWMSPGQGAGITLYQIEKGQRLVGRFTELGGPGFLGTETLTRITEDI